MRIDELFESGRPLVSFEFFPPKDEAGEAQLLKAIDDLRPLAPDFVSVTKTGGGTPQTLDLTARIQSELDVRCMAHMTCAGHTAEEMGAYLDRLWDSGVRNVLALRGDPPAGERFNAVEGGFGYATDLVKFARERQDFCVAVAGYPESHPQSLNLTRDVEYLKLKQDNGAHFVITQLFFDNADFFRWRDLAEKLGVSIPLCAGIMPISSVSQIKRFVMMCGAKIPHWLLVRLESLESDPLAVAAAGVDHAITQCEELLREGVPGLHFYTLNRSKATNLIGQSLRGSGALPAS
ncbi:MAG TPA: methylenetetrahydrofolate reductase [NAD(P)H] [Abditibacteriaceae bacterium]